MEIAQAPFAVLDVGLDEVAAFAALGVPFVALGELAGDELLDLPRNRLAEPGREIVVERLVAADVSGLREWR